MRKLQPSWLLIAVLLLPVVGMGANGCGNDKAEPDPYELWVTPTELTVVPGQRCVLLVSIDATSLVGDAPINITAETEDATVTVLGTTLTPGAVAEIEVVPHAGTENRTLEVNIHGDRGGLQRQIAVPLEVVPDLMDLGPTARQMQALFIPYLQQQHPELGITDQTEWRGTITAPQTMVVAHYLFLNDQWEMGVSWHVTIAPHDWVQIYLRRRYSETAPSLAFRVESVSSPTDPVSIDPPDQVIR